MNTHGRMLPVLLWCMLGSLFQCFRAERGTELIHNFARKDNVLLAGTNLPESEIQALSAIYESTDGIDWVWQSTGAQWNFSPSANPCEDAWQGVNCTAVLADGYFHVLSLALGNYSLNGELPISINNLTFLEHVDLHLNFLYGEIPTTLGDMSHLSSINLNNNFFYNEIPASIYQLSNLTVLDLAVNYLGGSLPSSISSLQFLTTLKLDRNDFSGSLPAELGDLQVLSEFTMSTNFMLRGDLSVLCNTASLQIIDLSVNSLMTGSIPDCFSNLRDLYSLRLDDIPLTGTLPQWLGTAGTPMLQVLSLPYMQLSGTIPSTIGDMVTLTYLDVSSSVLNGTLPQSMGQLTNLNVLSLGNNHLTGTLPTALMNLPSIQQISVPGNMFVGAVPAVTITTSMLTALDLSDNTLEGHIPASLDNLAVLQSLDLSGNKLTGPIPLSLCNLQKLRTISVEHNALTGTVDSCMGGLTALTFIAAGSNRLTGSIPTALTQLPLLALLDLSGNHMTGALPSALGNYSTLVLNNNQFTGTIHAALLSSPQLNELNLAHNFITGTIPAVNAPKLASLVLNNNHLSGEIPGTLSTLRNIVTLVLNDNKLNGPIAKAFNASYQTSLNSVILKHNQFTGTLPAHIFDLRTLDVFVASTNCFHGTIPAEICSSVSLVTLVLNGLSSSTACRNRLLPGVSSAYILEQSVHGTVPPCLYNSYMRTIQLSGNRLTGTLPEDALSSQAIFSLSLSHNRLTGTIPSVFQSFHFRKLDLSYNRLSGTLDEELFANPGTVFLQMLYLENNRISGDIPATVVHLVNTSILGTNMFACGLDKSGLPEHDPNRDVYHCASDEFNVPYYLWLALTGTAALLTVLAAYKLSRHWSVQLVWSWYTETSIHAAADSAAEHVWTVLYAMDWVCRASGVCAVYSVVVLLPLYAALSHYYGTLTYTYAWTVSAAFLSGTTPTAAEMVLWLVLLVAVLALLSRSQSSDGALKSAAVQMRTTEDHYKFALTAVLYFTANTVVVVGANALFVYISIYQSSGLLIFAQIMLAFFKFGWSSYCMDYVLRRSVEYVNTGSQTIMAYTSLSAAATLLNNVVIPCVVVAVASPNCFYNAFAAPDPVYSLFSYEVCADVTCDSYKPVEAESSYLPPFEYTYQCSSSLITYYAPAFVNLCIVSTFVSPVTQMVLQYMHARIPRGTLWFALVDYNLPRILKPLPPVSPDGNPTAEKNTYFKPNRLFVNLVTYMGILLTFGVVFPPLAVSLAVAVVTVALFARLKVGWFLCEAKQIQQLAYFVAVLERECEVVNAPAVLHSSMWMLVTLSCWFYTLFLFDTLGDAVGFDGAYWVLIVMPLMPAVLYCVYALIVSQVQPVVGSKNKSSDVRLGETEINIEMATVAKTGGDAASDASTVNVMHTVAV